MNKAFSGCRHYFSAPAINHPQFPAQNSFFFYSAKTDAVINLLQISLAGMYVSTKETTLERADFALQLSMFVTAEKEWEMFTIFFLSSFCQLLSPRF